MVYVKRCETYEKETILNCIREIFEQNKDVPLVALNAAIEYQNQINTQQNRNGRVMNWFRLFRK